MWKTTYFPLWKDETTTINDGDGKEETVATFTPSSRWWCRAISGGVSFTSRKRTPFPPMHWGSPLSNVGLGRITRPWIESWFSFFAIDHRTLVLLKRINPVGRFRLHRIKSRFLMAIIWPWNSPLLWRLNSELVPKWFQHQQSFIRPSAI